MPPYLKVPRACLWLSIKGLKKKANETVHLHATTYLARVNTDVIKLESLAECILDTQKE